MDFELTTTLEMMRNLIADHLLPSRDNWRRPY